MMRFWLACVVAAVSIALLFEGAQCQCSATYKKGYYTTRFLAVAKACDIKCMKEFHAAGDNINAGSKFDYKPIDALVDRNCIEGLKLMVSWGAKFHYALDESVCNGCFECVKVGLAKVLCQYEFKLFGTLFLGLFVFLQPQFCEFNAGGLFTCGVLEDFDFPSTEGILNDGKQDITANDKECCEMCASNPSCAVWTRVTKAFDGKKVGECWLRNFNPGFTPYTAGFNSGRNSCSILSKNTKLKGDSYLNDGKKDITESNEECCRMCNADNWCESWTRFKYDTDNNRKGECWLGTNIPDGVAEPSADSGQKYEATWSNSVPDDVSEGSAESFSAAGSHVQ
ncbi:hypothetical protein BSKO_01103 [Bryopsis sp. KO-2023]|nr:hypothetical protein BSKO_01103 [Bryopsis sp. KO-2023]